MVKIKKNLLLITTVLLPLSAFAKKWAFCPTSGSLNFDMQASKSSASVKMRKPTERTVKYVDTNLPIQQTSNVTCINIYTDVIPLYKSSILTWITDNNSQVPMTPEYASASQYFNANVNKNINADQFAINTPNSLMVGVVGKLTYSVSGNTYSCQNVFIGIGGSSIGGYNWWV